MFFKSKENPNTPEPASHIPQNQSEVVSQPLVLTPEQKQTIKNITRSIDDVVAPEIIELSLDDVIKTLENKHPLNQIIKNDQDTIVGYIACEDFIPHEAYIKYLSTQGIAGRNMIHEINTFLETAKQNGYHKLNFHGWNNRLNTILERFGFQKIRTDNMGAYGVDFYEKNLVTEQDSVELQAKRIQAFEDKFIQKITKDYEHTIATYSPESRQEKLSSLEKTYSDINARLQREMNENFGDRQKAILKLKLARYFQTNTTLDTNTLIDALIETPKFIDTDKGSLGRLFEVHQEKTIQKIAEMRKKKAEETGEGINPYEALFETSSGKYYMARLLNMPHLEAESAYMNHCVGTSDSYINKIKRGDIEILSFRKAPTINKKENKLNHDDTPIFTIEYNLKTKTIEQMKKANDEYLTQSDPYFTDVIDALNQLRTTHTDMGTLRDFKKINESELEEIQVQDDYVLTQNGAVHFRDYDFNTHGFILKKGKLELSDNISREDKVKIVNISFGEQYNETQVAFSEKEVFQHTKIYVGTLSKTILHNKTLETIVTGIDQEPILKERTIIGGKTGNELEKLLTENNMYLWSNAKDMLHSPEFEISPRGTEITSVTLSVAQLGFPNGATYQQIMDKANEYDLDVVPHDFAPTKRLSDLDTSWRIMHMRPIATAGEPRLFGIHTIGDDLELLDNWGNPENSWNADNRFVFSVRK